MHFLLKNIQVLDQILTGRGWGRRRTFQEGESAGGRVAPEHGRGPAETARSHTERERRRLREREARKLREGPSGAQLRSPLQSADAVGSLKGFEQRRETKNDTRE